MSESDWQLSLPRAFHSGPGRMRDFLSYLTGVFGGRAGGPTRSEQRRREEVIAFLREWLPAPAIITYRRMILADPENWHREPHFASGFVVEHFLRGNGITEATLGVPSLDRVWPALLAAAVLEPSQEPPASADRPPS